MRVLEGSGIGVGVVKLGYCRGFGFACMQGGLLFVSDRLLIGINSASIGCCYWVLVEGSCWCCYSLQWFWFGFGRYRWINRTVLINYRVLGLERRVKASWCM